MKVSPPQNSLIKTTEAVTFEEQKTISLKDVYFSAKSTTAREENFISLRWRLLMPLFSILLVILTVGAYGIGYALAETQDDLETNELVSASESVHDNNDKFAQFHEDELYRLLRTSRVQENIAAQNGKALHPILEPLAELAALDMVIVTNRNGQEIIGLQYIQIEGEGSPISDYAVSEQTDLSGFASIQTSLQQGTLASEIIRTQQGLVLITSAPVFSPAQEIIGSMIVGTRLDTVLAQIQSGNAVDLTLFSLDGQLILTTFPDEEAILKDLSLESEVLEQTLQNSETLPIGNVMVYDTRYQVAYQPLQMYGQPIGILAIYRESGAAFTADIARQVMALLASLVASGVVIIAYAFTARVIARLERIQNTVEALAAGYSGARLNMKPTDEIGVLATAIDTYADLIEQRTDNLVASLRRQYRENAHLTAIIESLADGLIVLDIDGRVLMMNSAARRLIGGMKTIRTASLNQLTAAMTDTLGPALAPGLYSLGDPTRLIHNEKMLQAQAAAIVAISGKRLGTVITLRDVTSEIQTQQQQEALLEKLSQEIQLPMAHIAQDAALEAVDIQRQKTTKESEGDSLLNFAREIARNARAMQRIVAELREVSILSPSEIAHNQSPFLLSELLWNVAAQWKPIAAAVDIDIELEVPDNASYILGDERRLRWALGNIVDNAIKYSLPTNKIKIIGREDKNDMVYIAIIDDGVGIQPEDLPNIFQRFYRGKPMASDGSTITTPGTGQGLYLARHVIRAHGGEIQVKSLPRVGTTVQVKLPLTSSVAFDIGVQQSHQNPTQQGVQDKVESDIANRRNHQTG